MRVSQQLSFFTNNRYDSSTGCWNWTGGKTASGYGRMTYNGKTEYTHRIAMHVWRKFDLASKENVLYKCDKPACFNPNHLFIGTQLDNMRDHRQKGRHFNANLTHCRKGHPLSGDNLYLIPSCPSGRYCRTCRTENNKKYYCDKKRA